MPRRVNIYAPLLTATIAGMLSACATGAPAPQSWYDFDTVWLNEGVGGYQPWRRPDYEAVRRAAAARERRWAAERGDRRPEATAPKPPKISTRAVSPHPRPVVASVEPASASQPAAARPPVARIPPAPPGLTLGDGTVSGELLAAARRLVGIENDLDQPGFLRHLLAASAADPGVEAPPARFVADVWASVPGRHLDRLAIPAPGDLAFFHDVYDANGNGAADDAFATVAVVEEVATGGRVTCIGLVRGQVRRFVATPSRPRARMRAADGLVLNTPVRRRDRREGPRDSALAGALLAGFARL